MDHAIDVPLKQTSLHARHLASGAKMVPYAGWDMPLAYSGISDEHQAVRTRAGLFDVSHMGEIEIAGDDALPAVQRISSNDAAKLQVGQAQYSGLLTSTGTFIDDLIVYRIAPKHFLLVVNAANTDRDYQWMTEQTASIGDVAVLNASARYALLAVQGPAAREVLQPLTGIELRSLKYFRFAHGEVAGVRGTVSRTGYTGEDGFEVFVPPQAADRVWQGILDAGRPVDIVPAGLGARDTLRLEAAMRLHGNDIDESTTALEAGLEWIVGWSKVDFNGLTALREQKRTGLTRRLVGFEMLDRGIARHGYKVLSGRREIGTVTSGTQTPFLKRAIGMAYVPIDHAALDTEFDIDIRGRASCARVVKMPFYSRLAGT